MGLWDRVLWPRGAIGSAWSHRVGNSGPECQKNGAIMLHFLIKRLFKPGRSFRPCGTSRFLGLLDHR